MKFIEEIKLPDFEAKKSLYSVKIYGLEARFGGLMPENVNFVRDEANNIFKVEVRDVYAEFMGKAHARLLFIPANGSADIKVHIPSIVIGVKP